MSYLISLHTFFTKVKMCTRYTTIVHSVVIQVVIGYLVITINNLAYEHTVKAHIHTLSNTHTQYSGNKYSTFMKALPFSLS